MGFWFVTCFQLLPELAYHKANSTKKSHFLLTAFWFCNRKDASSRTSCSIIAQFRPLMNSFALTRPVKNEAQRFVKMSTVVPVCSFNASQRWSTQLDLLLFYIDVPDPTFWTIWLNVPMSTIWYCLRRRNATVSWAVSTAMSTRNLRNFWLGPLCLISGWILNWHWHRESFVHFSINQRILSSIHWQPSAEFLNITARS
jgi:hypothetical protein